MTFQVEAPFRVQFIDLDRESGVRTVRGVVKGKLEARDEEAAGELVRAAVATRFPVCWTRRVGKVQAVPVS